MTAIRMKKEDRILHILDCTLTLVGRKQLESIRTAEIAKESNISEGALFKYFKSKSDIINQIMVRYENLSHPIIPADSIKTIAEFKQFINEYLSSMVDLSDERSAYLRLLLQVSMGEGRLGKIKYNQVKNGFWNVLEDRIKYGQKHWEFNSDLDIKIQIRLFHFSVLMFLIEQEIFNAKEIEYFDINNIKDTAINNFFDLLVKS
ncbi:MAG: TetR/AcrR family transcriptional regulator [Candidatus Marinimicrobia bacterium]|nr:TetR/AcrR family transcriptional regulator [Candidatus Neomarinimicrobiota bacterium]MBT4580405.1 TetR/AcrR family transcriptional regulator [Candidatus Neomarinimicrobiota bacterium]MBT5363199.1 TetR/AcrR family transcriptional regulator [Candidatus Neomarinimicrobiota bacterium]MBT6632643.1 TetR/AcrR family transcriptional regulator [Candidatus Neomarinimicrobiota bacterium]MBT6862002.1 TetR/AcrR family transcriptional regulator [Candidatus Neomarinimicrobiota bacterium]